MSRYIDIIVSLSLFTVVSIIFLVMVAIALKIFSKKINIENINVYGMFFNMKKLTIISFSLTTINYLMLIWVLMELNLNYIYVASIVSISIFANILADDFPYGLLNILNTIICLGAVYFVSYYNSLINVDGAPILIMMKWVIILFLFMYFTYVTLINLNHLLKVEKNRVIKEQRGNNNENRQFN